MTRNTTHAAERHSSSYDTHSLAIFSREQFMSRALDWGHTPLKNIPEQELVLQQMVQRIDQATPPGTDSIIVEFMNAIYQNRFTVRQERNHKAYSLRLNRTPYYNLPRDVCERRDKAMISAASYGESLQLQNELGMGSIEIARNTHPFHDAAEERAAVGNEILEACFELDSDTSIPSTEDRWKVRGSDVISLRGQEYGDDRRVRALFMTKTSDFAYMPQTDTMVKERHTYVLDLDQFAQHEPRVVKLLRQYDVEKIGTEEWSKKLTALWHDINDNQPLFTTASRQSLLDVSTTFYTVNQTHLALIAERDAKKSPLVDVPRLALLQQEDELDRARRIETEQRTQRP